MTQIDEPEQWAIKQHIEKNPKCEWLCTHTKLENLGEQPEIDEPNLDKLINNLVCANHALVDDDCIYCDEVKIKALIATQINQAKIDMLKTFMVFEEKQPGTIDWDFLDGRLTSLELKGANQ